jgi:hypothetical protein
MPAESKRKPKAVAASTSDTEVSKRAPKRQAVDSDAAEKPEAPPVKATIKEAPREGRNKELSPKPNASLGSESSESTPLRRWLQVTPRGPGRYRATGHPIFFGFDAARDEEDTSKRDQLKVSSAVDFAELGPMERKEFLNESCYHFPRKRLTAAMKKKFGLAAPPNKVGATNKEQEGKVAADGSPIQHGDIVGIDAEYRCVGWYIAYGPPEDMWLIRTGSEYGYCVPLEFCDAPPRYYGPERGGLHQFAFPSPALFLNLPSITWEEAKTAVSDFVASAYETPVTSGKKRPKKVTTVWTWYEEPQEPFATDGSDGFLVFNCFENTVTWFRGRVSGVVPRFVEEALVLPKATPFPVESFGKWKD